MKYIVFSAAREAFRDVVDTKEDLGIPDEKWEKMSDDDRKKIMLEVVGEMHWGYETAGIPLNEP